MKYKVQELDEIILSSDDYLKNILDTNPLCIETYISAKRLVLGNNSYNDRTYVI